MSQGETKVNRPGEGQAGEPAPTLLGLRLGPRFAGGLYALLVSSAVLALGVHRLPGGFSSALAQAAPWLFLLFVGLFAAYRLVGVRSGKYPAGKAFFQIALAGAVFALLLPGGRLEREESAGSEDALPALLEHADPKVRALAAEVVGLRGDERYARGLLARLKDPSPLVRERAYVSLVRLAGEDLGSPEEPGALEAWRKRYP